MSNFTSADNLTFSGVTSDGALPDGLGIDGHGYAAPGPAGRDRPPVSPSVPSERKRRSSKMKGSKHLNRSASTPAMRDMALSDEDKKRSKLGYQRISIACAHCRRRKIRCVIADGDPQSRCQNCIRLKKECIFFPVEQQTAMDNRAEPSSKSIQDSSQSSVVSPSPPTVQGMDRVFETTREFPPFTSLPSNAPSGFPVMASEAGSAVFNPGFVMRDYTHIDPMHNSHVQYPPSFPPSTRPSNPTMQYQPPPLHTQGVPQANQYSNPHSAPVGGPRNAHFGQPSPYPFNQSAGAMGGPGALVPQPSFANPWYHEHSSFTTLTEEADNGEVAQRRVG
ncbi:hypothetical protein LTR62_001730 [Meristemomyces frigidus]|uniref:Zn(2)-C6 fungal-type domain-containing protein n=1 Tax=Meristemomyces frigidus TaxID=1508187 RepID=A0AAN7TH46_9PEZI|nr:hypothetical protein LTR62_001730 [Meristemomyces frigidus]